jgi:hypothetical protein
MGICVRKHTVTLVATVAVALMLGVAPAFAAAPAPALDGYGPPGTGQVGSTGHNRGPGSTGQSTSTSSPASVGGLPFTGLDLIGVVLVGGALVGVGVALHRPARQIDGRS